MGQKRLKKQETGEQAPPRGRRPLAAALGFVVGAALAVIVFKLVSPGGASTASPEDLPAELAADPDMQRAGESLAEGRMDEAIERLEMAHRQHPRYHEPLLELARVHRARGDIRKAMQAAERAVDVAPGSAACLFALAEAMDSLGMKNEAEKRYLRAAELAPSDPRPFYQLGRIADGRGHEEVAMEYYRKALRADPLFGPAAHYLAISLRNASRFDEAVGVLRSTLEREPENSSLRCNLAHTYLLKGDAESAAVEFRNAIPSVSDEEQKAGAYYFLGRSLELQKKDTEALEAFRRALDWDPLQHMAWYSVAQLAVRLGRPEEAKAAFRDFERVQAVRDRMKGLGAQVEKAPGNVPLLLEYTRALLDAGRLDEAAAQLRKAAGLDPGNAAVAPLQVALEDAARARRERVRGLR